ncbi:hypothetical protein CCGE531_17235 [Rhizobium sp. CCGE531]|nr:hypothetical protein CCGE531_17235 [Rhizobium sp. CCGE531]AYG73964.1 hypothetical protein CCGE532_16740 [Rhizobium sp. CCGE532]
MIHDPITLDCAREIVLAAFSVENSVQKCQNVANLEDLKSVLSPSNYEAGEIGTWSPIFELDNECRSTTHAVGKLIQGLRSLNSKQRFVVRLRAR